MIKRFTAWFKGLSPGVQGMLIMIPLLLIGILLNWGRIWEGIVKGFSFFNR
jgi:hypothetical protein